jgi:hypothetical protein
MHNGWVVWTLFLVFSILLGLAALVWSFTVDIAGWAEISAFAGSLVWLTAISLALLGVLWGWRASLRWTGIVSIILFCGAVQWGLFVGQWQRVSFAFMPAILILIASAALFVKTAPDWISRVLPWLALGGIAFAAGVAIAEVRDQRLMERSIRELRERDAHHDRTLLGRERAAWLLGLEFSSQDNYDGRDFLDSGAYRDPFKLGDYRWDAAKQRLLVTRSLTVVPRAALENGVVDCSGQGCRITWEIDVNQLHDGDRALRKRIDDWVAQMQFNASH